MNFQSVSDGRADGKVDQTRSDGRQLRLGQTGGQIRRADGRVDQTGADGRADQTGRRAGRSDGQTGGRRLVVSVR